MTDDGLFEEMVDTVMITMADAFRQLWERPDARKYLGDWLDKRCEFVVQVDGIEVRYPSTGPAVN